MEITTYLEFMVDKAGSDIFFSAGARANIKVDGITIPLDQEPLEAETIKNLAYSLMDAEQIAEFERNLELNMAVAIEGLGRFRVNVFRQRGDVGMVIRYIKDRIPSIESLGLPPLLADMVLEKRGQILVAGATGSGKSTTIASMIDHRNQRRTGHILCIEDPVEFIHEHKKSVVDQREVGFDTVSYSQALKNALRQAPEVIVIGEIRDRETMEHALRFSETGHLCLSTLHAANANQALGRIVNFFPRAEQHGLLHDLALNLRAVISQRLIPGLKGKAVVAVEVMHNTPRIADLIATGRAGEIRELMESGSARGMMTFDQSLYDLYRDGLISEESALANADSTNDLRLRIHLEATRREGTIS